MKKIDLIHLVLLIVAILTGYNAIEQFLYLLSLLALIGNPYLAVPYRASSAFITTAIYTIACIVLVVRGRKFAGMLVKDDPEGSWADESRWDLDRRNMLFVLFIGIGLYEGIHSGSLFLHDLYKAFTAKASGAAQLLDNNKENYLVTNLLRLTFGAFLVYAAPTLTNFIEDKIAVRLKDDKKSD